MKFEQFQKHEPTSSSNVYVFVCEDELLVEESKSVWERIFGGEWDFTKLSAKEFEAMDPSELTELALSSPLFGPSKAFFVTDAGKLTKKKLSAVADIAEIDGSFVKVIFVTASPRSFRKVPKSFPTIEIDPLRPADTVRWLKGRFGVSPEVARYLVDNLGGELQLLDREMEKLNVYLRESRSVEIRDVDQLILRTERFGPFELDDALLERDYPRTVRIAAAMIEEGVEPLLMLSRLARVWRQIFVGKALGPGVAPREMAAAASVPHWKANQFAAACERFKWKSVALGFGELVEADRAFKTSSPDPTSYFDVLLWKLAR